MPRFTSCYSDFCDRLGEVELLRKTAAKLERGNDPIGHGDMISALSRSSVVLLSSHIEAFIRELCESALDKTYSHGVDRSRLHKKVFYYHSSKLLEQISETSDAEKSATLVMKFIVDESGHWGDSGPLPGPINSTAFLSGFANPRFKAIKKVFNRFGYQAYESDLRGVLQAQSNIVLNSLESTVDTRNKIAHGDPSATKTPSEIATLMAHTRIVCRGTDKVFADWCKSSLCNIR